VYLHIGQNTVVRLDDIVGLFDLDSSSVSKITREFLRRAEKNSQVVNVTGELPKSFIVCRRRGDSGPGKVYISQISSTTLLKRSAFVKGLRYDA